MKRSLIRHVQTKPNTTHVQLYKQKMTRLQIFKQTNMQYTTHVSNYLNQTKYDTCRNIKPNQILHGKQYENPQKIYIYH